MEDFEELFFYAKKCFRNFFNFKERSSKSEFWFFQLFVFLFLILFIVVDIYFVPSNHNSNEPELIFSNFFLLIQFIPSLSVSVRRLHDVNRSGWWMMLIFTGLGGLFLFYWWLKNGDRKSNKFGKVPKKFRDYVVN